MVTERTQTELKADSQRVVRIDSIIVHGIATSELMEKEEILPNHVVLHVDSSRIVSVLKGCDLVLMDDSTSTILAIQKEGNGKIKVSVVTPIHSRTYSKTKNSDTSDSKTLIMVDDDFTSLEMLKQVSDSANHRSMETDSSALQNDETILKKEKSNILSYIGGGVLFVFFIVLIIWLVRRFII